MKLIMLPLLLLAPALTSCHASADEAPASPSVVGQTYNSIYWSDADSGRLGELKFRLANGDAPETGSLKQRGGAKCEAERALGYDSKAFIVDFTKGKTIKIKRDYGKDRYGRLVVDLSADGVDVLGAGIAAQNLRSWPHKN